MALTRRDCPAFDQHGNRLPPSMATMDMNVPMITEQEPVMTSKATVGPYLAERHTQSEHWFVSAGKYVLASGLTEAAARLLAAAWEMREALRAIINNHCTNEKLFCSTCTPARALLARIDNSDGVQEP